MNDEADIDRRVHSESDEPAPLAPNVACLDYSVAAPRGSRQGSVG